MIASWPDLFKVSTPIDMDYFEVLLVDHPNPAFVQSVCMGLCEGFWPFTHTHPNEWPITWDHLDQPPKSQGECDFIVKRMEGQSLEE